MKRFTVKGQTLVLAALGAGLMFSVIGCGGGSTFTSPGAATRIAWQQQGATFLGQSKCSTCHAELFQDYTKNQPMGVPDTSSADARHNSEARCMACHVTGFGEPTGAKTDGSTPADMARIGCESCHGPGSQHINAENRAAFTATITRTPPDKACWDCHAGQVAGDGVQLPGGMNQPFTPVTEETLAPQNANLRGPHHPPAQFLNGRLGLNVMQPMPSPHASLENTCLACHMPKEVVVNGQQMTDHGIHAQQPNLDTSRAECASCHGGRAGELVQHSVKAMLIKLGGDTGGEPDADATAATNGMLYKYQDYYQLTLTKNTEAGKEAYYANYKAARYNFKYVLGEGSLGVHNPALAQKLLAEAIARVTLPTAP